MEMTRHLGYRLACWLMMLAPILSPADEGARLEMMVKAVDRIEDETVQVRVLQGLLDGFSGRREVPPPPAWAALNAKLAASDNGELRKLAQQLSHVFGDEAASRAALATLRDQQAEPGVRREALKALLAQQTPELFHELEALLDQPLHLEAIRAYGAFEHGAIPGILLERYADLEAPARRAVIETLATRPAFAHALLGAMEKGLVKKVHVPAYVARSLHNLLGEAFERVYGEVQQLSADKGKLIARYKAQLAGPGFASAQAPRGRLVYQQLCAPCHKLYDAGGIIGPDLTGSNRADQDYILLNILDPSFDVPEGYRMVTITLKNGQVLAGNIAEEDGHKVVLRMVGQTNTIAKADIVSRHVSKISLMPEGLLSILTPEQFLDLIKYLQTEKQVALP